MTLPDLQTMAQVFAERQVNAAVEGIALAILVWIALRFGVRQNSGTRFAVWFAALFAIVAFPGFSLVLASHVPGHAANGRGEIVLAASWASYLLVAWGVGVTLLLVRLAVGLWRVRSIRARCAETDPATLDPAIAGIVRTPSSRRQVRLCVSNELTVPAALGLFRPAIVFPADLLPQLSSHEVEMIVRHEMAHLSRWDDWTNLAQKIVKAVFFFHPAVWWIENRLTLEREMACDDIVLAQTDSPRAYASSLISFAEKLHSARGLALAQALVSRMHQMSLRVTQILDTRRPRHQRSWKPVLGASAGLLAVILGAAPYMPRLVAFEQPARLAQLGSVGNVRPHSPVGDVVLGNSSVQPVAQWNGTPRQPKMISAAFQPGSAAVTPSSKARPVKARIEPKKVSRPMIMRAAMETLPAETEPAARPIYVLRTTGYEMAGPNGSEIWTLCIWRVDVNNPADRQLESAIVLSLI
jgi:beta-lactamase regulating signal transducer with metallopeptidase domain